MAQWPWRKSFSDITSLTLWFWSFQHLWLEGQRGWVTMIPHNNLAAVRYSGPQMTAWWSWIIEKNWEFLCMDQNFPSWISRSHFEPALKMAVRHPYFIPSILGYICLFPNITYLGRLWRGFWNINYREFWSVNLYPFHSRLRCWCRTEMPLNPLVDDFLGNLNEGAQLSWFY